MIPLMDILSYLVFTSFQFAALCVMTRGGRGWPWRVVALGTLVITDVIVEHCGFFAQLPLDRWLAVSFVVKWSLLGVLIFGLSRDSIGRRAFLLNAYGAFAIGICVIFHVITYRNILGLPAGLSISVGLAVVVVLNLVLIFRILPLMPRDERDSQWRTPCFAAFVTAACMYVCGFWPVSVINSPARNCAAFWLMLVGVWVAFPSFCRTMRERQHNAAVERSLELMTAEVKVRRTALDEARRIRHDHRHHRIVLAGLLLRGKSDEALEYLNALDEEKGDMGLTTHVWCENETVNAILAGCLRKAMSMAVAFSAEVHVERTTPLSDVEIVAVIANLVENAINACGKVEGERRRVCVALRQRGDMFGMTVTNTVPTGFRLSSAGLPCAEFGVGLCSVRRVVDRYSGDWRYTLDGSELTCELVLCAGGSDGNRNL